MDLTVLLAFAVGLIILIVFLALFKKRFQKDDTSNQVIGEAPGRPAQNRQELRRAVAVRTARNRRGLARLEDSDEDQERAMQQNVEDELTQQADGLFNDGKIGAKKRAKLEAKAERKAIREAEQLEREEKKKREEKLATERAKEIAAKQAEEERFAEAERKALEEKIRKEQEEYEALKASFRIESEGFEEDYADSEENTLKSFLKFIQDSKVVVLEDLAAKFKLKTQNVIDRITQLQEDGFLTGVIDDRGKFIYVSKQELEGIAKFIRQRGRVSIADLAAASNSLINLTPVS